MSAETATVVLGIVSAVQAVALAYIGARWGSDRQALHREQILRANGGPADGLADPAHK